MPKGIPKSPAFEPVDFENVPRFKLGEQIDALRAEVDLCRSMAGTKAPKGEEGKPPIKELKKLAKAVAKLKGALHRRFVPEGEVMVKNTRKKKSTLKPAGD